MLSLLFSDPGIFLRLSLYRVPALLLTLCCHEWAHAYVAYRCGDPTARNMGRMTIDPRRHLDVMGTILMLTAGFGWAKPVPVNPRNYRNRIADDIKVSIAGITVNLILFLVFTALAVGLNGLLWHPELIAAIPEGPRAFLRLDGLNLMLVYGAEGYTDVLRNAWLAPVMAFITVAAQMNLMVAIFNLLPVPPLDGYHVVNDMLLRGRLHITPQIAQGGMLLLLVLSFATDILSQVMGFLGSNVQEGVLWIFLKLTGA